MSNPTRFGNFYSVWPVLDGKTIQFQWGEIRSNQAEAKAVIRNSFQELEDGVDELNALRALLGQAYGDLAFSNKYRFYYNNVTLEFCCQRNTGTVANPIWVDAWCVRFSDGQFQAVGEGGIASNAGFYGPGLDYIREVAESGSSADVSIRRPHSIFFNADDGFGVTPISSGANAGQPEIRFTQPYGRAQVFEKNGRVWQVNHDFGVTPVLAQVMDSDDRIVIPDMADVSDPNTAWFYFNSPFAGSVYIASGGIGAHSLVPRDPFYLVVRTDDMPASPSNTFKPNADMIFDRRYFYVNTDMDAIAGGAHKTAFISLISTVGGGGGVTDHGALTGLTDVADHPGYLTLDGTRSMTGDLNMGGNDVQNAHAGTFSDRVVAEAFYLEPGSGGEFSKSGNDVLIKANTGDVIIDDDVIISGDLRVADKVVAEAFYLANGGEVGSATSALSQAFGPAGEWAFTHNLNTRPLLWNVYDLGFSAFVPEKVDVSNPNVAYFYFTSAVEGTAVVSGGAESAGLAGINFRESDNNPTAISSDTLVFNSENFYLDATSTGKPQVNLRPRIYEQVGAFTKQQFAVAAPLTISGGNIAWNLDNAQAATLLLSSSATLSAPTNIKTLGQYTLVVTQPGGTVLSFNAAYKFGAAGAPTLSTVAGKRDILVFVGFGSELFLVGVSTGY